MQIKRLFSGTDYKGTRHYLKIQKKYEMVRTLLYFGISFSLLAAGIAATGEKLNLLTVVAILGCLPASKSAVSMIMYLRYKSLSDHAEEQILPVCDGLDTLYDMVFTSYDKNFPVAHMVVRGNTIIGYLEVSDFDEKAYFAHMDQILKKDGYKHVSVKIFTDIHKYTDRMKQLKELDAAKMVTSGIVHTLKSVVL